MKVSSKPISSPGRTEKFPPPLMRFLKSNAGSRSRGRSRSSPMFMRKKNTLIETQEPSSPKVTCIGQVRVRRSSKPKSGRTSRSRTPTKERHCWCVRKTHFCHHFTQILKPRSIRPDWRKWVQFFRLGRREKADMREEFKANESNPKVRYRVTDTEDEDDEDEDEEAQVKEGAEVFHTSSPPKNALLLTRCRSAPYRSSSLASRFWGSPLVTSETGDANEGKEALEEGDREQERPESESEPDCKDSMPKSRIDQESVDNSKEFDSSIDGRLRENDIHGSSARPLILTRCKSEPARTGERLNPEVSFWRDERLGFAEPCSPHVCD